MSLVVSGVSMLIHVYSVAYMDSDRGYTRFFAYLNFFVFSMLLLVLGGNFLMLIIGWAFVGAASYLLISFWYRRDDRDEGRHQGVRHQRLRRRRPRARHVLHLQGHRDAGLPRLVRAGRRDRPGGPDRRLHPAARRRVREVRAGAAAHLAGRRDGGPDAGLRAHPRSDDGDRGRLPHRAHVAAVRGGAGRGRRRRDHRLPDAHHRRDDRAGRHRPQAHHRLLDDVADRLHDHRRQLGRVRRRPVPPHDARVLQGAALHGGRVGHRRDGQRSEPRPHGRLPALDAVHVRAASSSADWRWPASRRSRASSPRTRSSPTRPRARTGTSGSPSSATSPRS